MQAITVATVNATYDWMANEARRTLEDVLDVCAHDRRPKLPPPVAQAGDFYNTKVDGEDHGPQLNLDQYTDVYSPSLIDSSMPVLLQVRWRTGD